MNQKKDTIDTFFDAMDKVVDGAAKVLKDMPEPDSDEYGEVTPTDRPQGRVRVIDVKALPEGANGEKKAPREISLVVHNVSQRKRGGVTLIAETAVHEMVAIQLNAEDWKKVVDAADWMRMVRE